MVDSSWSSPAVRRVRTKPQRDGRDVSGLPLMTSASVLSNPAGGDAAREAYTEARRAHWDALAGAPRATGRYYHRRLAEVYRHLISPGQRVLEIGCGKGDLLAALEPAPGVGIDFSGEFIRLARERHPRLRFHHQDAQEMDLEGPFDVVILSDLVNDLWDVQTVLEQVRRLCQPSRASSSTCYSRLWEARSCSPRRSGWLARSCARTG